VINELERKRKEAITTQFVVSIHHFAEENWEKPLNPSARLAGFLVPGQELSTRGSINPYRANVENRASS
jgi:hypothetical protein